jgi:hypothetical protein
LSRRSRLETEALPFEIKPFAGDSEGAGRRIHLAVMQLERTLDHLALDAGDCRGQLIVQ